MKRPDRLLLAAGLLATAAVGCDSGPPGAGLTNGPGSVSTESPAIRTDIAPAPAPERGEAANSFPAYEVENGPGLPALPADDTTPRPPQPVKD